MNLPQDILRRRALEYHQREDRQSSSGSMAIDMDLMLSGLVEIGKDTRLHVTDAGRAFLAQVDRCPKGQDPQGLDRDDESAVAAGNAS